eukprot:TRINITY_DN7624_c1_g3_i5.p1 TRINITY_DN7624_c1_g3~~TRINITY_DN7624_c1_g3_i5.p1  ORF type:complete len:303 (+),score=100.11 TRINITY_DN7624_c1_g3_i5:60-911(+)
MPGTAYMTTIEAEQLPETHSYEATRLTGFPRETFNINTIAEVALRSGALVILHKTIGNNNRGGMDPVMMVPGGAVQQLLQRLKAEFGSAVRVFKIYPKGYVVAEDSRRASKATVHVNVFPVKQNRGAVKEMLKQKAIKLGVKEPGVYPTGDGFNVDCHSSPNADKVFRGFSTLNGVVYEGVLLACLQKAEKQTKKKKKQSNRDTASQDSKDSTATSTCSSVDAALLCKPPPMQRLYTTAQKNEWRYNPYPEGNTCSGAVGSPASSCTGSSGGLSDDGTDGSDE